MSTGLNSTVVSTFIENDTAITVRPPADRDGDVWHLVQVGDSSSRVDLYFPEADLRRLRDAIDQHLAGA